MCSEPPYPLGCEAERGPCEDLKTKRKKDRNVRWHPDVLKRTIIIPSTTCKMVLLTFDGRIAHTSNDEYLGNRLSRSNNDGSDGLRHWKLPKSINFLYGRRRDSFLLQGILLAVVVGGDEVKK